VDIATMGQLQELLVVHGFKIIIALVIFIVGRWIVKAIRNFVQRMMTKKNVDPAVNSFVCSLIYVTLLIFVIIAALAQVGIQTTSLIAVLGAASLAIGLALQGSLGNFAAGVLILVLRPFKIGDFIQGAGEAGTVKEIQLFTTVLATPDKYPLAAREVYLRLKERKILVRFLDTRRLDNSVRITVGTDEETDQLLVALKDLA